MGRNWLNAWRRAAWCVCALLACCAQGRAQGVAFALSTAPRTVRAEGITEVPGELVLGAMNTGTIPAGSAILIDYGVDITGNISLTNNVFCNFSGFGGSCPGMSANLDNPTTLRLAFSQSVPVQLSDAINFHGVRANFSGPSGDILNASIYLLSSDPANFPLSATHAENVVIVRTTAIGASFNPSAATATPVRSFVTCAFPNDSANDFFIQASEQFPFALTTTAQEQVLSANQAITNGTSISITFTYVPAGLTVSATGTQQSTGALSMSPALPASSVDQTVSNTPITFTYTVLNSNISIREDTIFNFSLKPTTVSTTNPLPIASVASPVNVQAIVQLTPISTNSSTIVRFVDNQIGPATVATISNCRAKGPQLVSE